MSRKGKNFGKPDLMSKFIFSELRAFLAKLFKKRRISFLTIYPHHFWECMRQMWRQILPCLLFGKVHTEHYISKFECFDYYAINHSHAYIIFFKKQRSFSIQAHCFLTFSLTELHMLLRCCLIHITIIVQWPIL